MRRLLAMALTLAILMPAAAKEIIPLPRPRPAEAPPAAPSEPSACVLDLADRATIEPLGALAGPGACGAPDAVRLNTIMMPNHSRVALTPPPTLRCSMAQAITDWVRAEVGGIAQTLGAPLVAIENYDSYECRGMNRVAGAKLSEHGKANALDIRSVKLVDGRVIQLTPVTAPRAFRERIRESACARFMTVLGPGSDGYHEEHVHVDLAERHGDYRICHWEIHEPAETADVPLPRPRPFTLSSGPRL